MSEGVATRPRSKAPPGEAVPDRDLVLRAQSGDGEAFRMIFDRCADAVLRFTRDLLRDPALAEEATQETFVRAHARLPSLREGEALRGWLFGIARLVSLEQVRARWRAGGSGEGGSPADRGSAGPAPLEVDPALSPEGALLLREADQALDAALGALSGDRRAALLLRLDHGFGYEEIARAMGWSVSKVKNEIHRARLQLRLGLAPYLEEP